MRSSSFLLILIGIMVLLDFYVFQAVKVLVQSAGPKTRLMIIITYWALSILAIIILLLIPYINFEQYPRGVRNVLFSAVIALFFAKLIISVFLFVDDLRRVIQWAAGKIFFRNTEGEQLQEGEGISRSLFLTWLGVAAGSGLFASLVYGFTNKYNYHIKRVSLQFNNLPDAFRGLKIVQLSDIHSGSFNNKAAVQRGVEKVLRLQPDLILFTGDLVNDRATEMEAYMDVFNQLKAPLGVYSILGNHDYGDYVQWESRMHKLKNLDRLKTVHKELGWQLLLNENVILERGGEQLALLGVENWSAKARFPKYGNLQKAYTGTEHTPFKILMSHDPSHWDAEVRPMFPDIDLMLSGHTHGMQFGVDLPWFKWSPVQYVYKQWAGLYMQKQQKLYVNRGFGFIGYPGRVGILPEITLLELS
ncbi:MAG: metallophosphoesterase [Bacteroidota bacterium]|nr:metallophosphoesterase [Flavisolibacter sp.]MBD0349839.1 metallophosphoesterase [Flavisolibacter sp.]MBD0374887.1 metallophosphoesterase [Flavisolibacter sp.]MDQ3843388.1 metallophosphoesterase [Bacteroidota bacterium]